MATTKALDALRKRKPKKRSAKTSAKVPDPRTYKGGKVYDEFGRELRGRMRSGCA